MSILLTAPQAPHPWVGVNGWLGQRQKRRRSFDEMKHGPSQSKAVIRAERGEQERRLGIADRPLYRV
jgi:hypothetical protein